MLSLLENLLVPTQNTLGNAASVMNAGDDWNTAWIAPPPPSKGGSNAQQECRTRNKKQMTQKVSAIASCSQRLKVTVYTSRLSHRRLLRRLLMLLLPLSLAILLLPFPFFGREKKRNNFVCCFCFVQNNFDGFARGVVEGLRPRKPLSKQCFAYDTHSNPGIIRQYKIANTDLRADPEICSCRRRVRIL